MKKIILGGLLLVICVMMVITLVPGGLFGDYFGGGVSTAGVVAKVGADDITIQQVAQRARLIGRQQFRGANIPPTLMPFLMQRAADNMVSQGALAYEADRMGLGVSDAELADYLRQGSFGEMFFPGGNFIGQQQYENLVQNQWGLGVPQFEKEVKDQIAQQKLLSAVSAAATVSDKEVEAQVKKQDSKVKFDYAILTLDDVKKQVKVTDVELKAFYDQNSKQYVNSIPEKRKARYILIDTSKVAGSIPVTQADLQAYYNQHQDEYRSPETVTVRHILIKTPTPDASGKIDQKGVDAAKAKAEDVQKQLKAGADFGELAKKYSDDPGSAQQGGLLPPITRGRTVPEFEQAAFTTPKGQTTDIIRTSYGFHIIRVEDKHAATVKPLAEVASQIEPAIKQQKAAAGAQSLANSVQAEARSAGLDKAAADKGLSVTATDFVAQADALPGTRLRPGTLERAVLRAQERSSGPLANAARLCGLPGHRDRSAADSNLRTDQGPVGRSVQSAARAGPSGPEDAGTLRPRSRRTRSEKSRKGTRSDGEDQRPGQRIRPGSRRRCDERFSQRGFRSACGWHQRPVAGWHGKRCCSRGP